MNRADWKLIVGATLLALASGLSSCGGTAEEASAGGGGETGGEGYCSGGGGGSGAESSCSGGATRVPAAYEGQIYGGETYGGGQGAIGPESP